MPQYRNAGYDTEYGFMKAIGEKGKDTVLKEYSFQRNMTWAIEPGTLQYINGQVIGMSVLGGNILRIGQDGLMSLLWENHESPLVCGLYTHSIVYREEIFFMPYLSKQIVVFNYCSGMVKQFEIHGRLPNERMSPYIYGGELFLIATESGKIYKYQNSEDVNLISNSKRRGEPLLPKRDFVEGRKRVLQKRVGNTLEFSYYDCEKNIWEKRIVPDCIFRDYIWDEEHIWYASDEAVFEIELHEDTSTIVPKKIFSFDYKKKFISFVGENKDSFLMFVEKLSGFYKFDKVSQKWEMIAFRFLDEYKNILAYQINSEALVIRQFDVCDWMIRPGERYGIFHLRSGDYKEIPLFTLEEKCRRLLNRSYIKSVWSVTSDYILMENEKEGLEFLLATIDEKKSKITY